MVVFSKTKVRLFFQQSQTLKIKYHVAIITIKIRNLNLRKINLGISCKTLKCHVCNIKVKTSILTKSLYFAIK